MENVSVVNGSLNINLNNSINNNSFKIKRDRSKNFLPVEREQLLQICSEFIDIIENKKTDSYTCKKKYEAWVEIAKKFNAIQTTGLRNDKNLKTLYDNMKRDFKKQKNGETVQLFSTSQYVGNATSLCNVLINESANNYELNGSYEQNQNNVNEGTNNLNTPLESNDRLSIKEEPSEPESESAQPLSNSFSSKDSVTSDCNYTSQLENLLTRKNNVKSPEICDIPPSTPVEVNDTEEYHKARLRFLEIEHRKKMEILELEQQCLLLKRDLLKAKLEAVIGRRNESKND